MNILKLFAQLLIIVFISLTCYQIYSLLMEIKIRQNTIINFKPNISRLILEQKLKNDFILTNLNLISSHKSLLFNLDEGAIKMLGYNNNFKIFDFVNAIEEINQRFIVHDYLKTFEHIAKFSLKWNAWDLYKLNKETAELLKTWYK